MSDAVPAPPGRDTELPEFGAPNPKAPPELSRFAFLIGRWRCESKVKGADGKFTSYTAA